MNDYIESLGVIGESDRLLEATLNGNGDEVSMHVEDGECGIDVTYSLDEIRAIVAALGHLLWVADNLD